MMTRAFWFGTAALLCEVAGVAAAVCARIQGK
jgi:hypothetical protein